MTSKRRSRDDEGAGESEFQAMSKPAMAQENPLGASALLPFDVIKDILSRLPVQSLVRFESVSKPFLSLIKSPDFVAAHLARSARKPAILLRRFHNPTGSNFAVSFLDLRTSRIHDIRIPFIGSLIRFPKIVGSCSGLLCLDISPCYATDFALWNVATGSFRSLPRPRLLDNHVPFWMVSAGFGCETVTDDFYIVRIVAYGPCSNPDSQNQGTTRVEVFSLKNDSWKILDGSLTEPVFASCAINEGQLGVAVRGSIYWVANGVGKSFNKKFVICYDMINAEFRSIALPDLIGDVCVKIMELKESLALTLYPSLPIHPLLAGRGPSYRVELWVLDECSNDGKHWVKLHTFQCPIGLASGCPVGIWNNYELILKRQEGQCLTLSVMDPRTHGVKKLAISPADFSCDVYWYVESLLPVHVFPHHQSAQG